MSYSVKQRFSWKQLPVMCLCLKIAQVTILSFCCCRPVDLMSMRIQVKLMTRPSTTKAKVSHHVSLYSLPVFLLREPFLFYIQIVFLKIWNRISGAILELLSNDRDGNYFAERGISNSSYSSSSYTNGSLGSSSPGPSPSFPIGQASSGMHLNYKNEYLVRALLRHQLLSREYAVKLLMPRETGFIE